MSPNSRHILNGDPASLAAGIPQFVKIAFQLRQKGFPSFFKEPVKPIHKNLDYLE